MELGATRAAPVTATDSPVAALVAGLVDDAGLFPPTALAMPEALARHRADLAAGHPLLAHRFLCPASRLEELRQLLAPEDTFALGLIADRGARALAADTARAVADPRLRLALVELPLSAFTRDTAAGPGTEAAALATALDALGALPPSVPVYVEPLARARSRPLLDALTAPRAPGGRVLGAKLRCGGVRAELFPTAPEVAAFLVDCVRSGVPFKATAGLHEAVRHTARDTGFRHHGYLNLLLATAEAVASGDRDAVLAVLETEDAAALADRAHALDAASVRAVRRALVSYGSCGTATPVREASAVLGLAPRPPLDKENV